MSIAKLFFILFLLPYSCVLYADGQLGDIVYSHLSSEQFNSVHGQGWINISSKQNIKGSDLCKKFKICELPNASGTFFRVYGGQSGHIGLVQDFATAHPEIPFVGKTDFYPDHSHGSSVEVIPYRGSSTGLDGGSYQFAKQIGPKMAGGHKHIVEVNAGGDIETRPINIALYAYIKINDVWLNGHGSSLDEKVKNLEKGVTQGLERKVCSVNTENLSTKMVDDVFSCHKNLIESYEGLLGTTYRMSEQELQNSIYVLKILAKKYSLNRGYSDFMVKIESKYPLF